MIINSHGLKPKAPIQRTAEQIRTFVRDIEAIYLMDRPTNCLVERRTVERTSVTLPVGITLLDENHQPQHYCYEAISRDISAKGIGLVTTSPISNRFVQLKIEPCRHEPFEVIAKVVYCNDLGYYFQIGCEFVLG